MIYITTPSQFIGELNVVQNSCNDELLQYYIEQNETELLVHILGAKFYSKLQTELLSLPLTGEWKTLVNGGEYSANGYPHYFKGLKEITARLIYLYIQKDQAIYTTANGGLKVNAEAGQSTSVDGKVCANWNKAVSLIGVPTCSMPIRSGTLKHFLESSELEDYCLKTYKRLW
jgi:hypothetical protein